MTPEQVKAAIRHEFDELNKKNLAVIDDNYSPNIVVHHLVFGTEIRGLEAFKQEQRDVFTAFPDHHRMVDDIVVGGGKVAIRHTWSGTHEGKSGNIAPTGKRVTMTMFSFRRYEGGKVVEQWNMTNRLSFYQQLGVTPTADMK